MILSPLFQRGKNKHTQKRYTFVSGLSSQTKKCTQVLRHHPAAPTSLPSCILISHLLTRIFPSGCVLPTEITWPESGAGSGCRPIFTYISAFQCFYPHSPFSVLLVSSPNGEGLGGEDWGSRGPNVMRRRRELRKGNFWLFLSDLKDAGI